MQSFKLKHQAIRAVISSSFGSSIPIFIHFFSIPILARLILPEYFGLIAMLNVFLNFAKIFKDLGLSQAIIQKTNLTIDQSSTIFWIILILNLRSS